MAERVWVEVGETDLLAEAFDQLAGLLAREPLTGGREQQRPFGAPGLGLVDGVCDRGVQRRDGGLGGLTLALQAQDAVAALLVEIPDVRADCL